MHPALSVIFFTTLSGAGFGLLLWVGVSILLLHGAEAMASLRSLQLWALALGAALAVAGLLSSLAHLGKPLRAWRALSQWRSSWLSREGLLALLTLAVAAVLGALLLVSTPERLPAAALGVSALLLAVLALATVASTAMIYASLPPIPAWRHPLVVPVYLLFAALSGLALLFVLMAVFLPVALEAREMLALLAALAAVIAIAKLVYWRDIDRTPLAASRGGAVGLPRREVTVFERPHTEPNFITREMAFVVARTHATRLRWLSMLLLVAPPVLGLALLAGGLGTPLAWLLLTTATLLAGAFVERWLFFAQARHMVTLYY